jgi:hypothetical protein
MARGRKKSRALRMAESTVSARRLSTRALP